MQTPAKTGIFYGWVIVLVSFVTLTLVMGSRFTFGVFYPSILQETGWNRASTAGIFAVSMLVYALAALGVGAAFDRLGPRRLFPLAALLLGAGYFFCGRIATLWQFYVYYGVLVGAGYTALGFIPHVSLIFRWFVRRRGLASSLALSGMGVGSLIFAPVGEYLIAQYGWRQSYTLYAVLIPVVVIPVILLWYRNDPASLGLYPDGDPAPQRPHPPARLAAPPVMHGSYTAALSMPAFWVLFLMIFTIACNTTTLLVHQNQYLVDIGFSQEFAAWMLGLSGILRSAGSVIWGSLSDRTSRQGCFIISTLLGLIAMPCLMSVQTSPDAWRVVLFVLLIGLGYGGTSVLYATTAADLFQGPHFGKILGILDIGFGLGSGLGSYLAGVLFDRFQTYQVSFYMIIVCMLVSILSMWVAVPRMVRTTSGALTSAPADP